MELKELGLSQNEEQAYRWLIEKGRMTASQISRGSGVSYGKIYEVLANLEKKGFVKIIPEKTKVYAPSNPQELLKIVEEKEQSLQHIKEEVQKLKTVYDEFEDEPVQIIKGKHNFYKIIRELEREKTFSYTLKFAVDDNPEILRMAKRSKERGTIKKHLVNVTEETIPRINKFLPYVDNMREFSTDNVAMTVCDSYVFIVLAKKNTIMTIRDEGFISVMKRFFEAAYEKAPEIKKV